MKRSFTSRDELSLEEMREEVAVPVPIVLKLLTWGWICSEIFCPIAETIPLGFVLGD